MRDLRCCVPELRCSLSDLVPWPGIEPGPWPWEPGVLGTGPLGMSLAIVIFKNNKTIRIFQWDYLRYGCQEFKLLRVMKIHED